MWVSLVTAFQSSIYAKLKWLTDDFKMKLTKEDRKIAESNSIPISTVYRRLEKGWDKDRAITEQPNSAKSRAATCLHTGEPGRLADQTFSFRLPPDLNEQFNDRLEKKGQSVQEYLETLVTKHLNRVR